VRNGKEVPVQDAEAQTLTWKALPYDERRDLITKMYGTIAMDKCNRRPSPGPDSSVGWRSSPRAVFLEDSTHVDPLSGVSYQSV